MNENSFTKTNITSAALLFCAVQLSPSYAADCSDYPQQPGMDYESVEGYEMPKIIATERAIPFSEDLSDIDDAMDEAEIGAKARIMQFRAEFISETTEREKLTTKLTQQNNNNVQKSKETVETIRKFMSQSTSGFQRGVVPLGDCYTPGKEVRVSVGIKPETLLAAEALDSAVEASLDGSGEAGGSSLGASEDNLNRAEGHSNSDRLEDF